MPCKLVPDRLLYSYLLQDTGNSQKGISMKLSMKGIVVALGCLLCFGAAIGTPASAASSNLITNGGFETGDYSGWTLTNDESPGDGTQVGFHNGVGYSGEAIDGETPIDAHTGNHYFYFGNAYSDATLSQQISTQTGQNYDFSFYINTLEGAKPNDLKVNFGNNQVFNQTNITTNGWTKYDFTVTANAPIMAVAFAGYNNPTNNFVDDVSVKAITDTSVKAVPEGSTTTTFAVLFICSGLLIFRLRRLMPTRD